MQLLLLWAAVAACAHAYSTSFKVERLNKQLVASRGAGFIKLDTHGFDVMVADEPRNYSIILLTTALEERFGCEPCRLFDPVFKSVAGSYARMGGGKNELYFAYADYSTASDVFAKLGLQSAPNVMHFPPNEGPRGRGAGATPTRFEISEFDGDVFADWVSAETGEQVKVVKPVDYSKLAFNGALLFFVAAVVRLLYSRFEQLICNPKLWAAIVLIFSIHMNSGFMWNQIRGAPYSGMSQGKVQLIADGFQNQFQVETQLVSVMYALSAAAVVFLVQRVPKVDDGRQQRLAVYAGLAVFLFFMSLLMAIFRVKNGGYPFRLLL